MVYGRYGGRRAYTQSARPIVTINDVGSPGPDVTTLVRSAAQPLSSLMVVEVHAAATHHWAEVRLPAANRAAAAYTVAVHIAWERCCGAPQYFDAWAARREGGRPHEADFLECIEGFLGSECVGTRDAPAPDEHIEGFVAEHIWHLLTLENALAFGIPLRVDGPDWSATDSGGDGLAVYRAGAALIFRLWESKAHTGDNPVRDVVNGACRQVTSRALRYLARFSKVGQTDSDAEVRHFYGCMPEMWKHAARGAGGGVSVSTASGEVTDCFGNYPSYWTFAHGDQRQGLVVTIDDYAEFAQAVREELWKGL